MSVSTYDFALAREQDQVTAICQRCDEIGISSCSGVQHSYLIAIDRDVDVFGFMGVTVLYARLGRGRNAGLMAPLFDNFSGGTSV
jgi:hypothetical protein